VQFIRGEVARISAGYETALTGLNGRIRDLNVPKHVQHLSELPGEFSHEIESLGRETRHGLGVAREDGGGANPDSKYFFGVKRPN
jgi:hypothetical protein